MITLQELNPHAYPTTPQIDDNLKELLKRINIVRMAYKVPLIVSSGLRSQEQQDALIKAGKSSASKSRHLTGQAVDIQDLDGKLKDWVLSNLPLMISTGLWLEDFKYTPTWCHFQIVPYGSWKYGKSRFFVP